MNPVEQLQASLKDAGYSNTTARETLFLHMLNNDGQSPREIAHELRFEIDQASVYRNLQLFETLGVAHKVYFGWKYVVELSDTYKHHHHHALCLNCQTVITIQPDSQIEAAITLLGAKYGLSEVTHQLEIHGLCQNCQQIKGPRPKGQGLRKPHTSKQNCN